MSFNKYLKESLRSLNEAYANIIFLQSSEDFDSFKGSGGRGQEGFFDSTPTEMAQYLSQWDMGSESETDITNHEPWGTDDTVVKVDVPYAGTYWLSYNSKLGYAGLTREVDEDI